MRLFAHVIGVLAFLAGTTHAVAAEVWVGVWKLNVDSSPKAPNRPQSQIITMKAENGMVLMIEDNITANGMRYQVTFRGALDGKDYPMTGSIAGIELIAGTMLNPDTVELKAKKKDGSIVGTYWITHSADGKMRITLAWMGSEVAGPPARIAIHDRQ
jgi:hypothetical protein